MKTHADAFARLRSLFDGLEPARGVEPVLLHLGEQRLAVPVNILSRLEVGEGWSRYPQTGGTTELRAAYAAWLARRFGIASALTSGRIAHEPMPGAKQGLAAAITLAVGRTLRQRARTGCVVIPRVSYPTYRAAAEIAGATVINYDADAVSPARSMAQQLEVAPGPVSAIVVCHPNNPTGAVIAEGDLHAITDLARRYSAALIVDETYIDLWLERPIQSALALLTTTRPPCSLTVLHTLSKRSGAPGLRSGFIAGDPALVAEYAQFNRTCGVSLAGPVCRISAELWRDDRHVDRLRAALLSTWRAADATLGRMSGYRRADAGFFCWLPVSDGETAAKAAWQAEAVMVMPGAYLAGSDESAAARHRVRVALVHPPSVLAPALARLHAVVAGPAQLHYN